MPRPGRRSEPSSSIDHAIIAYHHIKVFSDEGTKKASRDVNPCRLLFLIIKY